MRRFLAYLTWMFSGRLRCFVCNAPAYVPDWEHATGCVWYQPSPAQVRREMEQHLDALLAE